MKTQTERGIRFDISCEVCRDLMPLVRDGVASADSEALVRAHTEALRWLPHDAGKRNAARAQHAGRCAGTAQAALEAAGAKRAVRAGGRAGRAVAHLPRGDVYLAWWLPLVGAACYYVLRRRCWLVPATAAAFVLLYFFIPNMQSLQWGSVVLYASMALAVAGRWP